MSNYSNLTLEEQNGVAKITLNRPDAANALNVDLARELMQAAIAVSESETVRAVILSGNGKLFCAGGDIQSFGAAGDNVGNAESLEGVDVGTVGDCSRVVHMPLSMALEKDHLCSIELVESHR